AEIFHLDDLYAESFDLFALVARRRANADLDEPFYQTFFHNSRERAGVRVTITLKFVINVRVRVEMQDAQTRIFFREGFDDRVGNRVISAERDGPVVLIEQRRDLTHDPSYHRGARNRFDISGVEDRSRAIVNSGFAPRIRGF